MRGLRFSIPLGEEAGCATRELAWLEALALTVAPFALLAPPAKRRLTVLSILENLKSELDS